VVGGWKWRRYEGRRREVRGSAKEILIRVRCGVPA
jgi:hypothetical protein